MLSSLLSGQRTDRMPIFPISAWARFGQRGNICRARTCGHEPLLLLGFYSSSIDISACGKVIIHCRGGGIPCYG